MPTLTLTIHWFFFASHVRAKFSVRIFAKYLPRRPTELMVGYSLSAAASILFKVERKEAIS
jgi:hypothetical protein